MAAPSARGSDPAQSVGCDSFLPSRPLNTGPRVMICPLPNWLRFSPATGPSTVWPMLLSFFITSEDIPSSTPIKELSYLWADLISVFVQDTSVFIIRTTKSKTDTTTTLMKNACRFKILTLATIYYYHPHKMQTTTTTKHQLRSNPPQKRH